MSREPDREPGREPPPGGVAGEAGEESGDGVPAAPEGAPVDGIGRRRRKRRHERFRVPAWVVVFLGPLAGWVVADMLGAILGLVIGVVAWRSRV